MKCLDKLCSYDIFIGMEKSYVIIIVMFSQNEKDFVLINESSFKLARISILSFCSIHQRLSITTDSSCNFIICNRLQG